MEKLFDILIIGAGPAGMTAAIYAARANMSVGVDHMNTLDVEFISDEVVKVDKDDNIFTIKGNYDTYTSRTVLVATGTQERLLGIENEERLTSRGVSYCAVCDANFFKDQTVVVIGGGSSALEESLYLKNIVKNIYIVIRRDVFRGEKNLVEKVENTPNIEIIRKHIPTRIIGDDKVTAIEIEDVESHEKKIIETQGIFPYIGADPVTTFVKDLGVLDERGYIKTDQRMATSVPGLYGAGDCIVKHLRQVITATNDGAIAANTASEFLNNN